MDVWRITLAALRRWYVLLPLLAVTGVAVVLAGRSVAPEYEATASAMITPERAVSEIPNPYGGISSANEALGIVLNSVESRQHVGDLGLVTTYEVGTVTRSSIVQFNARGPEPDAVIETGDAVLGLAVEELSQRQTEAGLPAAAQYTLQVLEPPAIVSVVQTGKTRIQAVVAVAGAAVALLVAVLFDDIVGLFRRRRDKRKQAAGEDSSPAADGSGSPVDASVGAKGDEETADALSLLIRPPGVDADALIHTDQWVWPDEQRPIPSGRPRRNPYFDPEFTKRSWDKLTAANGHANNGITSEAEDQQDESADDAATSEATQRS